MALFPNLSGASQWEAWMGTNFQLLDTPEKAIDFAETVVRVAYGPEQVAQERPFVAEDLGDKWRVHGENRGLHALPFFAVSSIVTLVKKTGVIVDFQLSMPLGPGLQRRLRNE
ncbi:hypothetical protein GXW71_18300 [Roseomonas hellenica]|uniref:NTF2 fold domain-containing protein n=1 Tax=Plastoroseomonas hellenica TaxID=2687306 RepID=A0ABS5F191_9PROT|nr:NTF2 fold immunity protein [Plastoroseomonas hellenica]MBR0666319.1 hypothetical protein [Plastoroseomonas hellenica]